MTPTTGPRTTTPGRCDGHCQFYRPDVEVAAGAAWWAVAMLGSIATGAPPAEGSTR